MNNESVRCRLYGIVLFCVGGFKFGFIEENAWGNFLKEVPPHPLKNL